MGILVAYQAAFGTCGPGTGCILSFKSARAVAAMSKKTYIQN
jgi:hypothetical protein